VFLKHVHPARFRAEGLTKPKTARPLQIVHHRVAVEELAHLLFENLLHDRAGPALRRVGPQAVNRSETPLHTSYR
jgi:hypothetical protein